VKVADNWCSTKQYFQNKCNVIFIQSR